MSSEDGDVVYEVVVEIKSAVVGCTLGVSVSFVFVYPPQQWK